MSDTVVEGNQDGAFQALLAAPWLGLLHQTAETSVHANLLGLVKTLQQAAPTLAHTNLLVPVQFLQQAVLQTMLPAAS